MLLNNSEAMLLRMQSWVRMWLSSWITSPLPTISMVQKVIMTNSMTLLIPHNSKDMHYPPWKSWGDNCVARPYKLHNGDKGWGIVVGGDQGKGAGAAMWRYFYAPPQHQHLFEGLDKREMHSPPFHIVQTAQTWINGGKNFWWTKCRLWRAAKFESSQHAKFESSQHCRQEQWALLPNSSAKVSQWHFTWGLSMLLHMSSDNGIWAEQVLSKLNGNGQIIFDIPLVYAYIAGGIASSFVVVEIVEMFSHREKTVQTKVEKAKE